MVLEELDGVADRRGDEVDVDGLVVVGCMVTRSSWRRPRLNIAVAREELEPKWLRQATTNS